MSLMLNVVPPSPPVRRDVASPGRKQQRGAVGLRRGPGRGPVVGPPAAVGPAKHGGLQGRLAETVPVHQHAEPALHPLRRDHHQGAHDVPGYRGPIW